MNNLDSIKTFKDQSTWRLVGLAVLSLGVYFAHYIKRQTAKINVLVGEDDAVSQDFVNSLMAISYIALILYIANIASQFLYPTHIASNIADLIWSITIITWGFMARNRLNTAYEISKENKEWFHGFWIFSFSMMYFNYKINSICKKSLEQPISAGS